MSPACGCQQSVRLERLLSEAAADSWPHSGLAEFLSIADVTRRSCDLHQRGDDPVGVMRAPHLTHAAAAQQLDEPVATVVAGAHPPPCSLSVFEPSRRPHRRVLTQRLDRTSQLAVESSRDAGRPIDSSHHQAEYAKPYPTPLGDSKPTASRDEQPGKTARNMQGYR